MGRPICRHCHERIISRPCGLCWRCYYAPGIREMYPSTSKYGRRSLADFNGAAPIPEPTAAEPGSRAKVAILKKRAAAGESLHHADDAGFTRPPELDMARDAIRLASRRQRRSKR